MTKPTEKPEHPDLPNGVEVGKPPAAFELDGPPSTPSPPPPPSPREPDE